MKTFVADIIPKIQRFSKRLDDLALLTNQHWVSLSDISNSKVVYIFRSNNQLLVSENGLVEKGTWEYLGNQSLLIEVKGISYLIKQVFFDENVLAIKLDSSEQYAFFVNENKYGKELNNIDDIIKFLEAKYLRAVSSIDGNIQYGQKTNIGTGRLPKPNEWVRQMLMTNSDTLIRTTINWRQFCDSHSEYYPLYTYQELLKRGIVIPDVLQSALNKYAIYNKFTSFEEMSTFYFD